MLQRRARQAAPRGREGSRVHQVVPGADREQPLCPRRAVRDAHRAASSGRAPPRASHGRAQEEGRGPAAPRAPSRGGEGLRARRKAAPR
jgi:hypothetical protein